MGYTPYVTPRQNTANRNKLRLLFGILLCSLVVVFSTSAKLAAYVHAPAADQIKSMKMPLKSLPSITEAAVDMPMSVPEALFLAFVVVAASSVTLLVRRDETLPTPHRWFSPTLAVRPPPSF